MVSKLLRLSSIANKTVFAHILENQSISTRCLQDDNAYQIDHIVPFSRSNNDGITNKVLVLTEENQKKSNKTPFEYFGADENRWKGVRHQSRVDI